jgi:hypothetical protein
MFRHVFHCSQGRCVALAANAVFSFTARRGERLRCLGGRVLLSQFNVAKDFDLRAGAELVVETDGLVVIEAVEAAVLVSVGGEKNLQQLVQITLPLQRWANLLGRHFQQFLALSGK